MTCGVEATLRPLQIYTLRRRFTFDVQQNDETYSWAAVLEFIRVMSNTPRLEGNPIIQSTLPYMSPRPIHPHILVTVKRSAKSTTCNITRQFKYQLDLAKNRQSLMPQVSGAFPKRGQPAYFGALQTNAHSGFWMLRCRSSQVRLATNATKRCVLSRYSTIQ
jgi:hypothetical protein